MKTKLTLLFICIVSLVHAQYDDYYYTVDQPMFGLGIGYNFVSIVGNDVRPVEISFRYRINSNNMLQLYVPFLHQNDDFTSQSHPDIELVNTSLDSKKRLYGVGLDYDYALHTFSALDFVIGLRAEYQLYKYTTNLTNNYTQSTTGITNSFDATDLTSLNKKTRNYVISPNVGMRLYFNKFAIDTKFLLSMISSRGDVDHRIEAKKNLTSNIVSTTEEWTDEISTKFKLKPAVMMSVSYFF
ncbi:MAG: hypothetical protein GX762_06450 [Bacteroidales bacterium]|nr:hypothetical protein [Bacteroidales bacterium]